MREALVKLTYEMVRYVLSVTDMSNVMHSIMDKEYTEQE